MQRKAWRRARQVVMDDRGGAVQAQVAARDVTPRDPPVAAPLTSAKAKQTCGHHTKSPRSHLNVLSISRVLPAHACTSRKYQAT